MRLISNRIQKGDTIIEVLLVIGIVSLVLAGAFAATNRSLQASRSAQERSEALKIAETQVERIKYIKDTNLPFVPTGTFCIGTDGITLHSVTNIQNEANCLYGERYYVSIVQDGTDLYQMRVMWLSATRSANTDVAGTAYPGYEQLQLFYRI